MKGDFILLNIMYSGKLPKNLKKFNTYFITRFFIKDKSLV